MMRCVNLKAEGPSLTVLIDWWQLAASSTKHFGQTWHAEALLETRVFLKIIFLLKIKFSIFLMSKYQK